jgi:hypothetical protein
MSSAHGSATSVTQVVATTALTFTHDIPVNTIVTLVKVALTGGKTVSTVTIGGVSASAVATAGIGGVRYEIWKLANPGAGTAVAIVVTPSASCGISYSAISHIPDDQSHIFFTGQRAPH